jgi:hypothetical protein
VCSGGGTGTCPPGWAGSSSCHGPAGRPPWRSPRAPTLDPVTIGPWSAPTPIGSPRLAPDRGSHPRSGAPSTAAAESGTVPPGCQTPSTRRRPALRRRVEARPPCILWTAAPLLDRKVPGLYFSVHKPVEGPENEEGSSGEVTNSGSEAAILMPRRPRRTRRPRRPRRTGATRRSTSRTGPSAAPYWASAPGGGIGWPLAGSTLVTPFCTSFMSWVA